LGQIQGLRLDKLPEELATQLADLQIDRPKKGDVTKISDWFVNEIKLKLIRTLNGLSLDKQEQVTLSDLFKYVQ